MGFLRKTSCLRYPLVIFLIISIYLKNVYASGGVFNIKMQPKVVSNLKKQSANRMLTAAGSAPIDFHIGGNYTIWTYFTELSIGTPPQKLTVQIDTGSEVTWLNCQNCISCPTDDSDGKHLKQYNPEASNTAEIVKQGKPFCDIQPDPNSPCVFNITYYDGSAVSGYFVSDYLSYNKVTGNHLTQPAKTKFTFGCNTLEAMKNNEDFEKKGLSGLLGLGSDSTTLIHQMSSSGTTRNIFSMCLDRKRGGGIFAIGKVVNPKVEMLKRPDDAPGVYGLRIQSMMFGEEPVELGGTPIAIFDTGSDVAFIPETVQVALANLIGKHFFVLPIPFFGFHCFYFLGKKMSEEIFDSVLPHWTFKFSDTASFTVPPHNYMVYDDGNDRWCIATNKHDLPEFILGVPFLSDKLMVYDNEDKTVGFMDYDCTSSVEVEDDATSQVFDVDSHVAVSTHA